MDSFTQVLLGIATVEVIAGRQLKNKTFIYGAILGTLPDLDVIVGLFMDPVSGVAIHRGISHSIFLFLLVSPIFGWAIAKIERGKINIQRATLVAFFGLFTHVLLDSFTSWGTQILWPLSHRYALKTIFVVDLFYTIPLLISLIYVYRSKTQILRSTFMWRGIIISSAYLIISCSIKLFALHKFENALQNQNISYREIIVKPTAFNTILWNANIATAEGYLLGDYSLFDTKPISFKLYKGDKLMEQKISNALDFKKLTTISEGWYIVNKQNDRILFNDLRFGLLNDNPDNPQFAFSYEFKPNTDGSFTVVEVPKAKRDGKLLLQKLWKRLQGN
ncbi:metal-dependent hydrolase [Flavobacterium antarcticum]|uniref:metal-dependent hydrolase n=1 Tax=Flavobacterium antarcticum TaxID=271155 RepID=UPI0003B47CB0|nr:metal-dependent hydrolase [Flavobacterium antarcticum]